jgi:hypothetical protein
MREVWTVWFRFAKSSFFGLHSGHICRLQIILQRWLDAIWTPVGSKLCSDPRYQKEFMEPTAKTAAAFVYFLVRGEPALGIGGRKRKQPKAPAVTFALRPQRKTPMLELNDCCPLRCIPAVYCRPSFQGISLHRYPPDEIYIHFSPAHLRPQF